MTQHQKIFNWRGVAPVDTSHMKVPLEGLPKGVLDSSVLTGADDAFKAERKRRIAEAVQGFMAAAPKREQRSRWRRGIGSRKKLS